MAVVGGLRALIGQVLSVDPKKLSAAARPEEIGQVIARMQECIGALTIRQAQPHLPSASEAVAAMTLELPDVLLGARLGELLVLCLEVVDAELLLRLRTLGRRWCAWAESDALWRPLTERRWPGTSVLIRSGIVSAKFLQLYIRRSFLERNRVLSCTSELTPSHMSCSPPHRKRIRKASPAASDYDILVEFCCGEKIIMNELLSLSHHRDGNGLMASCQFALLSHIGFSGEPPRISLTVVRRADYRFLRVCKDAEFEETSVDQRSQFISFDVGGDAGDSLAHPALWSVVSDCPHHHIGLGGVGWGTVDGSTCIERFEYIWIGLWDCRDLLSEDGADRVLTVWNEAGEWT